MERRAIHRRVVARVPPDGNQSIVVADYVQTIYMAKLVTKHVNAKKKIQKCVIHGRADAIVRPAGVAHYAIDHVPSSHMARTVICLANVKMVHNALRSMVI